MNGFEFCPPEEEGLASEKITEFIDFIKRTRINLHSFMLLRHGRVLAEAYYKPFDKDTKRRLYSCSKSVVSLAVGLASDNGLISLDAPMISYFPEIGNPDPKMAAVTVKDVLTMTVPQWATSYKRLPDEPGNSIVLNSGWTEAFFSSRFSLDKPAGKLFLYNSATSYVLCDLVRRVTGKGFLEYLRPVFDKIGVSEDIDCVLSPDGVEWGSSGVICTMRDFAKIGYLILEKGNYRGEQLISRDYMEAATSKQIDTVFDCGAMPKNYGYGYQIWIEPFGYGLHGLGSQFAFCFPDKDFLFVCNSNTENSAGYRQSELYEAAARLYLSLKDGPIKQDGNNRLASALAGLEIDHSFGKARSSFEKKVGGRRFILADNPMGISEFTLDFNGETGVFRYVKGGAEKSLPFGAGRYEDTFFPETHYYGKVITKPSGRRPRALVTGSWTSENRLLLVVDVCDTVIGGVGIVFEFYGDSVALKATAFGEDILGEYNGYATGTIKE